MLTPVLLDTGGTDTDDINYTTVNNITPTAGRTVLAAFWVYDAGGNRTAATLTGCGLTWSLVLATSTSATTPGLRVFRASSASGTPSTGKLTITGVVTAGNTADGICWCIVEIPGTDITVTDGVIQSDAESVGTADNWTGGTLALGAFRDASSGTVFFHAGYDSAGGAVALAAGAGFTELASSEVTQVAGADTLTLSFNYAAGNVTTAVGTASAANDALNGVMMEIGVQRAYPAAVVITGTQVAPSADPTAAPAAAVITGTAVNPAGTVTAAPAADVITITQVNPAADGGTGVNGTATPAAVVITVTGVQPAGSVTAAPAAAVITITQVGPAGSVTAAPAADVITITPVNPTGTIAAAPASVVITGNQVSPAGTVTAFPATPVVTITQVNPAATGTGASTATPAPVVITVTPVNPSATGTTSATASPAPVVVTIVPVNPSVSGTANVAASPAPFVITLTFPNPVMPIGAVTPEVSAPGGAGRYYPMEHRRKILRDDEEVLLLT